MLPKEEIKHTPLNLTTEVSEETYLTTEYSIQYEVSEYENKIEQWAKSLTLTIINEREVYLSGAWPNRSETKDTLQIVFHNDDDTLRHIRNLKLTVDAMLTAAEVIHAERGKMREEDHIQIPGADIAFGNLFGRSKEEND
jgi:hypothetical protein